MYPLVNGYIRDNTHVHLDISIWGKKKKKEKKLIEIAVLMLQSLIPMHMQQILETSSNASKSATCNLFLPTHKFIANAKLIFE